MRLTTAAIAVIFLAAVLAACGGNGEPPVHLLLEADISRLPAEIDRGEVMEAVVATLEGRARAFGIANADIQLQDSHRVSVTLGGGISEEDARQLMERRALLEFRQPLLDENGDIRCQGEDGSVFSIAPEQVDYEASGVSSLPVCRASEGMSGDIIWLPAISVVRHDQTRDVEGVTIQPAWARVDWTRFPRVVLTFRPDDAQTIEQTSERMVGLPMGIFLDGELLIGPTILEPLTTGEIVISGQSLHDANIIAAQLNGGELPVPVTATSTEETP